MAVLVGDGRQAAVLGLDRVVAGPDAGVADLGAAERVLRGAGDAGVGDEGVPAVAPDGVLALVRVAVGLVAAGVDDLQVVDVAVGLVEVAVAVEVVAVLHVVGGQLGLDLLGGAPARFWSATHWFMPSLTSSHVLSQTMSSHGKPLERP